MTSANVRPPSRPGLFLKLLGAFFLILLVMALLTTFLARQATLVEYTVYTTALGERQAELLAPTLADYYRSSGGWAGVEDVLAGDLRQRGPGGMMGPGMMGPGSGMMRGGEMWEMMGLRVLVVDAAGRVVADSVAGEETMRGHRFDLEELAVGTPVVAGGEQVGTVLATPLAQSGGQEDGFLREVNRALLWAVLGAGALALLLGSALTWRLTRPLHTLTAAAEAIAAGDYAQQVDVRPGDEIGDLAAAFNQMAERLARSEALRRQLTADVAHELRTPLTVIQGNVEALQDGVFPLTQEALTPIKAKTELLIRLVEDLRQLALAEAEALSLEKERVKVAALVEAVVAEFRPAARAQQIALAAEIVPGLPLLNADRQRLVQVLANLLSNALRHTPAGGQVTVTVATDLDEIPGFRAPAPSFLAFTVRDGGPGIAPADLPNLFERFYRADQGRGRDEEGGGSGLGLAIARALVKAHEGTIGAANATEGGAIFWFALPQ